MSIFKFTIPFVVILSLAGCLAGPEDRSASTAAQQTPQQQQITPEFMAQKKFQSMSYTASGKTYVIYFKRDPLARADKVVTHVTRGTPFTATFSDDREVQNMLRDAYRARGRCPEGQHPGLINLGYGPFRSGDTAAWSAYVRCSDKMQANI